VLGLEVVAGRWLEPGDGDLNWVPVVISCDYANLLYESEDPIGKVLIEYGDDGQLVQPERRTW